VIAPAIRFEVWLPLAGWNGKFEGTGNGGYAGAIVYSELADGVRRHYATADTDMGHKSTFPDPGRWALGHPELIVDQGYLAQHLTAERSKAIVRAFYGKRPRLSYFVGCSSGGWQGLTEAERYPHDYNGKDMVYDDPAWDFHHIDYDRAVRLGDEKLGAILNNSSPDLSAFRRAGGKLILWHGWSDPFISTLHTLEYYEDVAAFFAGGHPADELDAIAHIQDFARLFLLPGVYHCGGGPGPDRFNALGALEGWVERGVAPRRIVAAHLSHGAVTMTRPLCPYPQVARYSGHGSTNVAANFICRRP
jgi:Tannase and feruloyl esterase